jgi:hypothetical protein
MLKVIIGTIFGSIGFLIVIGAIIFLIFFIRRRRNKKRQQINNPSFRYPLFPLSDEKELLFIDIKQQRSLTNYVGIPGPQAKHDSPPQQQPQGKEFI